MKKPYVAIGILSWPLFTANMFAQAASITWSLTKLNKGIKNMTKLRSAAILFLITFLLGSTAHAQWSATSLSGNINTVFSNGSVLLAGTNGGVGVAYTPDDGINWGGADAGMTHILMSEPCKILR